MPRRLRATLIIRRPSSHELSVSLNDSFSAEEVGTGSRATLTPSDHAFLESAPTYEEGGSSLFSVVPPPVRRQPPAGRRVISLLLFVGITGSASALLGLAALRLLGHAFFQ